jgi:outer membrane protein assembly factor BamB
MVVGARTRQHAGDLRMKTRSLAVPLALAVGAAFAQTPGAPRAAVGWPQWGGPTRDFKAPSTGLASSWPGGRPRQVWSRALGEGYSTIVADGPTLYTMYRPVKSLASTVWEKFAGGTSPEAVVALDAATGKTIWEHVYDAPHFSGMGMEYGPGPHSTPLVVEDIVYAVGVTGKLHALEKRTGRVVWARDLWKDLGGKVQGRGYSCSPIAYGSTIVLTVGGRGQAVMAFDGKTGAVAWKAHDFDPSPASPILINVDGQDQLVFFHARGVAGIDPRGGPLFWSHPHHTDYGLNISTPLWGDGNLLFVSSAYSGGSRMLRLAQSGGKTAVTEVWYTGRVRIHFGSAIRLADRVYGSSGDFGPAFVVAVDVKTGQVAWQERGFARANFVYADRKLILLDEDGTLALAAPTSTGLGLLSKAEVLSSTAWAAPTVVGTRLYLRDRATIKALDLG